MYKKSYQPTKEFSMTIDISSADKFAAAKIKSELQKRAKAITDDNRATLIRQAIEQGVGLVHIHSDTYSNGGMTVAFRKSSPTPGGAMVDVAVVTCSEQDTFSRKVGSKLALEAFFDGKTVSLPLNRFTRNCSLAAIVKSAFTTMYYTY